MWWIAYLILSLIIGIIDARRFAAQQRELASYPTGDIGEYVMPKRIFGIHNFIFLPSILVVGANRIFNR